MNERQRDFLNQTIKLGTNGAELVALTLAKEGNFEAMEKELLVQTVRRGKVEFQSKQFDIRRKRNYFRRATLSIRLPKPVSVGHITLLPRQGDHDGAWHSLVSSTRADFQICLQEMFYADAPSEIISEREARERLLSDDEFKQAIIEAIEKAVT